MVHVSESLHAEGAASAAGLCTTCVHVLGCGWRTRQDGPILHCDDHDVGPSPGLSSPEPVARAEVAASESSEGLCTNCLHRGTCRLPRAAGGVWHCEEYA